MALHDKHTWLSEVGGPSTPFASQGLLPNKFCDLETKKARAGGIVSDAEKLAKPDLIYLKA
eukprot:563910-Pelagomonas_calceolata.AAC.4